MESLGHLGSSQCFYLLYNLTSLHHELWKWEGLSLETAAHRLGWTAEQWALQFCLSLILGNSNYKPCHYKWVFTWALRVELRSSLSQASTLPTEVSRQPWTLMAWWWMLLNLGTYCFGRDGVKEHLSCVQCAVHCWILLKYETTRTIFRA